MKAAKATCYSCGRPWLIPGEQDPTERNLATAVKALQDILLDGPIWRAQRIAKEALAAVSSPPERGK